MSHPRGWKEKKKRERESELDPITSHTLAERKGQGRKRREKKKRKKKKKNKNQLVIMFTSRAAATITAGKRAQPMDASPIFPSPVIPSENRIIKKKKRNWNERIDAVISGWFTRSRENWGFDSIVLKKKRIDREKLCRRRERFKNWPGFIALVIIDVRVRDGPEGFSYCS